MDTTLHNLQDEAGGSDDEDGEEAPPASEEVEAGDGDEASSSAAAAAVGAHVALVALRPLPSGVEVFNTYGTRSAISWLLNYGFIPDDYSGCADERSDHKWLGTPMRHQKLLPHCLPACLPACLPDCISA